MLWQHGQWDPLNALGPLNAFPWVLNGLIEALVSIRRLEEFLGLPDFCREEYYSRMYDIIQPQQAGLHTLPHNQKQNLNKNFVSINSIFFFHFYALLGVNLEGNPRVSRDCSALLFH